MDPSEEILVRDLRGILKVESFCPGSFLGSGRGLHLGWSWPYHSEGGDEVRPEGKALSMWQAPADDR